MSADSLTSWRLPFVVTAGGDKEDSKEAAAFESEITVRSAQLGVIFELCVTVPKLLATIIPGFQEALEVWCDLLQPILIARPNARCGGAGSGEKRPIAIY